MYGLFRKKKLYMHKSPHPRVELVGIRVSDDEDPKGITNH